MDIASLMVAVGLATAPLTADALQKPEPASDVRTAPASVADLEREIAMWQEIKEAAIQRALRDDTLLPAVLAIAGAPGRWTAVVSPGGRTQTVAIGERRTDGMRGVAISEKGVQVADAAGVRTLPLANR